MLLGKSLNLKTWVKKKETINHVIMRYPTLAE